MSQTRHIQIWPGIVENISNADILHMAMRHVACKLTEMVGRTFVVEGLAVETIPLACLNASCSSLEEEAVGIYLLIEGDLPGEAILTLSLDDAVRLSDWLLETRTGTPLDDMACSALAEMGNLTLSSFLNALSDLTGIPLRLSPPAVVVDMLAVIFEAVALSAAPASDELLRIKTDFIDKKNSLRIQFCVLPDMVSLSENGFILN